MALLDDRRIEDKETLIGMLDEKDQQIQELLDELKTCYSTIEELSNSVDRLSDEIAGEDL